MEQEAEQLEEQSERVDEHIREAREDWERKEEDPSVPGAQADPDEESEEKSAGTETPRDEGTATGNPDAAGSDEPGSDD